MAYTPTEWNDGDTITAAKLNNAENGLRASGYTPTTWATGDTITAEKLNKLEQGIADAQVSVEPLTVTENGTVTAPTGTAYSPVTVNVPASPVTATENDVNFLDYDGTIVYSYTAAEFANLTAMPANPTHEGLTAQGWNWSLADAKAYVTECGMLDIGQMYITDNGDTRIVMEIEENAYAIGLSFAITNAAITINWGDGSEEESPVRIGYALKASHEYNLKGNYCISISSTSPLTYSSFPITDAINSDLSAANIGPKSHVVEFHQGNAILGAGILNELQRLRAVTCTNIGSGYANQFMNDISLKAIIVSNNEINAPNLSGCTNLQYVSLPISVTNVINNSFNSCNNLKRVQIPPNVETIGNSLFSGASALKSVSMPSITVLPINTFYHAVVLENYYLGEIETIGEACFRGCKSLNTVILSNTLKTIMANAFRDCEALEYITIPNSVTTLGNTLFPGNLKILKFESTTPPTATASSFSAINKTICTIYVPVGSLTAYTSAANYPNPSTYTYVEY